MDLHPETEKMLKTAMQESFGDLQRWGDLHDLLTRIGYMMETRIDAAVEQAKSTPQEPEPKPCRRGEMTRTEKVAYIGKHGAEAFTKLPE